MARLNRGRSFVESLVGDNGALKNLFTGHPKPEKELERTLSGSRKNIKELSCPHCCSTLLQAASENFAKHLCSPPQILTLEPEDLQQHFEEEASESAKYSSKYARNLLEYACFKALSVATQLSDHLRDKKFPRPVLDMMLAWETPGAANKPSVKAASRVRGKFHSRVCHRVDSMFLAEKLAEPLSDLPPVEFAFSYGSGVFAQASDTERSTLEKPMVDYILGVSCPAEWHSKNIEKNPHHYSSWLAKFGGKWVSGVADKVGVGVHFNPFVPWKDKNIKYGVVSMEHLERDISTWNSLYISGRLQKPVCVLLDTAGLTKLNEANLNAALLSAMLLAPPEFTEEELYMKICGLSYLGDIRMFFAEDRHKVQNIVRGSSENFQVLYRNAIHSAASSGLLELSTSFGTHLQSKLFQRVDTANVCTMVSALPSTILQRLASQIGVTFEGPQSGRAVAEAVSQARAGHAKLLRQAIGGVVRRSSIRQMVSGLLAAGGVNAVQYVARKASKAWLSRR